MTKQVAVILVAAFAAYVFLAVEAVSGGRTPAVHGPALLVVLVAWALPGTPAILVAGGVGLACDAIGAGLLGPGMIAATLTTFVAGQLRERWELDSLLAVALFGIAVSAVMLIGREWIVTRLGSTNLAQEAIRMLASRAITTALVALGLVMLTRILMRLTGAMTKALLSH